MLVTKDTNEIEHMSKIYTKCEDVISSYDEYLKNWNTFNSSILYSITVNVNFLRQMEKEQTNTIMSDENKNIILRQEIINSLYENNTFKTIPDFEDIHLMNVNDKGIHCEVTIDEGIQNKNKNESERTQKTVYCTFPIRFVLMNEKEIETAMTKEISKIIDKCEKEFKAGMETEEKRVRIIDGKEKELFDKLTSPFKGDFITVSGTND